MEGVKTIAIVLLVVSLAYMVYEGLNNYSERKEESTKDFVSYVCKDIIPGNRHAEDACFDNLYESIDDVKYHNIFTSSVEKGLRRDTLDIIK